PDSFSPYYDPHVPSVEPLPLRVGQPVTIKITLQNRAKFPAEVTATFFASDWNIGGSAWREIGNFEHVALQPGEHKELKTTWTPEEAQTHQCFKVEVNGRLLALTFPSSNSVVAAALPAVNLLHAVAAPSPDSTASQKAQQNIGPVIPAQNPCMPMYQSTYPPWVYQGLPP